MSPFLALLIAASLGLAVLAAAASCALCALRRRPVEAHRLLVLLLLGASALPLAQLAARGWTRELAWNRALEGWLRREAAGPLAGLAKASAELVPRDLRPSRPPDSSRPARPVRLSTREARGATRGAAAPAAVPRTPDSTPSRGSGPARPVRAGQAGQGARPAIPWVAGLALVYLLGLGLCLARTTRRLVATRRLLCAARPVPEGAALSVWRELAERSARRARIRLLETDALRVPACGGLARPAILLPPERLLSRTREGLRAVLLHEIVHLERRDGWTMLLQELFKSAFWFHPAAWWVCRRLDALRELSCDLIVVLRTRRLRSYAQALVECAQRRGDPREANAAATALLPLIPFDHQLKRRIEMLVSHTESERPRRLPLVLAGSLLAALWGAQVSFAGAFLAPADEPQEGAAAAPGDAAQDDGPRLGIRIGEVGGALAAQLGLEDGALLVDGVVPESPAARAGLARYDVLVSVDGAAPSDAALAAARRALGRGDGVDVVVVRKGEKLELTLGGQAGAEAGAKGDAQADEAADATLRSLAEVFRSWERQVDSNEVQKAVQQALDAYRAAQAGSRGLDAGTVKQMIENARKWQEETGLSDERLRAIVEATRKSVASLDPDQVRQLTAQGLAALAQEGNVDRVLELAKKYRDPSAVSKNEMLQDFRRAWAYERFAREGGHEEAAQSFKEALQRSLAQDLGDQGDAADQADAADAADAKAERAAEERKRLIEEIRKTKDLIAKQQAEIERLMKRLEEAEGGGVR